LQKTRTIELLCLSLSIIKINKFKKKEIWQLEKRIRDFTSKEQY
jgi:hypothetical protein